MFRFVQIFLVVTYFFCLPLIGESEKKNYTIVTAFFDIKRGEWKDFQRGVDLYLSNAKRVMSLDDYMVIYIEPKYVDFVKEHREKYKDKTKIIVMSIEDLPYYKYKDQIQAIMDDPKFKNGLAAPQVPEVTKPLYNVIMWSKVPLVVKTIDENPFKTDNFVWLDFGIHTHMLQDSMLNKPLLSNVSDKIKFLCRSYPSTQDLDTERFYKSHTNRFAGSMFSGNASNFRLFNQYIENEVQDCLKKRVVDCDQSLFSVIFLKHPDMFELSYGDWGQIIANYNKVTQNRPYVAQIAKDCRVRGNEKAAQEIEGYLSNFGVR